MKTKAKTETQRKAEDIIIGNAYKELKSLVIQYAELDYPILLVGETGTGKELFAELYMAYSNRSGQKQAVNCSAFNNEMLSSEIFGHLKGAYTGALVHRKGLLKASDNGILFLDELGGSSPQFQLSILRSSEYKTYRQVGSDKVEEHNTLLIAATNNLGNIATDLKYRFHILYVPPLQKEDILLLTRSFFKDKNHQGDLKKELLDELIANGWPGNVRELKKHCERLYIEQGDKLFSKKSLPEKPSFFEYNRYTTEYEIWLKHIQPLIDEHNLDFRYQYQPVTLELSRGIPCKLTFHEGSKYKGLNLIELLHCVGRKEKEALPEFIENFEILINENYLPNFLAKLQYEDIEKMGYVPYDKTLHMWGLSYFIKMKKKEAEDAFEKFYITHNLEEYKAKAKAAEAMGISQKNLDRIWRKHYK